MKKFSSYRKQLSLLRSRGLQVKNNNSRATKILKRVNYYKLINGYKDLFLLSRNPNERYLQNSDFSEIYSLYEFDRKLRHILFEYILIVENNIKALISYHFSQKHGHDNYLKISSFDKNSRTVSKINELISIIHSQISNQYGKNGAITHYIDQYGYVPLWVLTNIMTFGTISHFYALMQPSEKNSVAKELDLLPNQLETILKFINLFRNKCAHEERLYNFKSKINIPVFYDINSVFVPVNNANYNYGKQDLFALLIVLKKLLSKTEFKQLCKQLRHELKCLNKNLSSVSIEDVKNEMGLPQNWFNITTL